MTARNQTVGFVMNNCLVWGRMCAMFEHHFVNILGSKHISNALLVLYFDVVYCTFDRFRQLAENKEAKREIERALWMTTQAIQTESLSQADLEMRECNHYHMGTHT